MASRRKQQDSKHFTEMILDKLQLLVDEGVLSDEDRFAELKRELKEVRDFISAARGLDDGFKRLVDSVCENRRRLYSSCELHQALSSSDSIAAASIFGDFLKNFRQQTRCLDDSVHQSWQGFYYLLLKDGLPSTGADRESVENFRQQMRDFYKGMWDSMVQFFSESRMRYLQQHWEHDLTGGWEDTSYERDRFIDLLISFQRKVEDILRDSRFAAILESVQMNRKLLEEFLRLDSGRRLEFIKRFPVVALFAARLYCWILRDGIRLTTSESVEKINPAADQASLAYAGVWVSESPSLTLSTKAMTCIDSIIDFCKDDRGLKELKVELSLVKIFFLCARKLCYSSYRTELLEDSVCQNWPQFYSFLPQLKHGLPPSELAGAISNLRRILKSYRQKFSELYIEMSDRYDYCNKSRNSYVDSFLEPSSSSRDEFMEFFYFLLRNLVDIVILGEACDSRLGTLLEQLQEKLVFLKNFILFASLQGKPKRELMEHCGVVAFSAAHLCYICWFFRDDSQKLGWKHSISKLRDKIMPVDPRDCLTYIRVLESGTTSPTLSTEKDVIIVGEFVDSLQGRLWNLLLNCSAYFGVSLMHQLRMLFEGLQFLRNILNKEKYDGLPGRIKCIIGAVVNDAGVVIFSPPQYNIPDALAKEIDVKLFCLLGKINTIKAAVDESSPVVPRFNFPTTNVLGIIDHLLDKLKELASYKVDPVSSFVKDRSDFLRSYLQKNVEHPIGCPELQRNMQDLSFLRSFLDNNLEQQKQNEKLQLQAMQDDLVFVRSFLKRNREHPNYHEGLEALRSDVVKLAYKAEFAIDSLIVGDVSFYSLLLLDNVREEIVNFAQKATEISRHVTSKASNKRTTEALDQVPSEGGISTNNKAVVELKDEAHAKIDQLIGGSTHLDMVSFVGMPDRGKTALEQQIYHDPSVTSHFHILAWCCVSQTYCKKNLLLERIDKKAQDSEEKL